MTKAAADLEEKTKEAFTIIGQFLLGCGFIEYHINYIVEQNFSSKTLIDKIHGMPVEDRWRIVKENIPEIALIGNDEHGRPVKDKIADIDKVIDYFKANIKPIRDMLAHGMLTSFDDGKVYVTQSLRHKKKGKDLLDPMKVLKESGKFKEYQDLLFNNAYKFGINGTGWQKGIDKAKP